jgi:hypothetical protein
VLWYKGRVFVPNIKELKDKIFWKAHKSAYSIHLGRNKMYYDLKATCCWYGIKRDVVKYIALCDREWGPSVNDPLGCCNLCKYLIESGKRLLQKPSWDCLGLNLDMISLWVIVDWQTKMDHFRPVKMTVRMDGPRGGWIGLSFYFQNFNAEFKQIYPTQF